jgi:mono/diheme cytochrome c family protein
MKISIAAVMVLAAASSMAFAQDGGALYKAKCAMCHGDAGQGKPAMGAIKLAGTTKSEDAIAAVLTKGGGTKAPHVKPMMTVTPEQAKSVATYVKSLK